MVLELISSLFFIGLITCFLFVFVDLIDPLPGASTERSTSNSTASQANNADPWSLDADGTRPVEVGPEEALGVLVEGEPGVVYETGRHRITPFTSDGRQYTGENWRTVRFETGLRNIIVEEEGQAGRITSIVQTEVTDPMTLWEQTPDPDNPVRSLIEETGRHLTEEDEVIGDLSLDRFAPALADCGVRILSTGARRTRTETYELETTEGDSYEVTLELDETIRASDPAGGVEDEILSALPDAIANASSDRKQFDADELNDHFDEHSDVTITRIQQQDRVSKERENSSNSF
jgi:hypothetical protein